jgi:hypothetical protein
LNTPNYHCNLKKGIMAQPRQSSNLAFVHHKRTGEVEIRRADGYCPRPKVSQTPKPVHLHYTSPDLSNFCRCPNLQRHKFSSPFSSNPTHLAANLTRYLAHHDLETSSVAHFHAYNQQWHTKWAQEGIRIANFHYATKQKDVVCRCTKPNNHGGGVVRNQATVSLCAAYFAHNKGKMTCTKAQWRENCAEAKSPESDSFKYDSREVRELLRNSKQEASSSFLNCLRPSSALSDMKHLCAGPNGEPDVPEQVWEHARPSVWNARRGSETSCSTPLGTAATTVNEPLHMTQQRRQSMPLEQSRRASIATVWSIVQRDAAGDAPESAEQSPRTPLILSRGGRPDVYSFRRPSLPDGIFDKAPVSRICHPGKSLDRIAQPGLDTASSETRPTELPAHRRTWFEIPHTEPLAELPTEYTHSAPSPELDGTNIYVDYYDQLPTDYVNSSPSPELDDTRIYVDY